MSWGIPKPKSAPTKRLLALGLAVTLGFSAICGGVLWTMGERDFEHNRTAAANLVASIASEIDRNIELYDLSLRAVVDGIKLPEINKIAPELRQVVLFDRAATAKDMGSILVLDAGGTVTLDSRSLVPAKKNFAGSDFFQVHAHRTDSGLFISRPWVADDGQYLISFSRRISNADGSFGGVVAGSMRLSYFHSLFKKLRLGENDSMNLLSADGTILMRAPFDIDTIGQSLRKSTVFKQFPTSPAGSYKTVSILDHVERLFVFQQVGSHPLLIIEGVSLETIYADWWQEVSLIGSLMAALCAIVIALTLVLVAALKRRSAAESQLALLASTDSLTGLSNRRRFDDVFAREWLRAQRARTAIALLMIDADNFKAYNDAHGHQAGDTALGSIAACIAGSARRASDLCARYGGEEFAVLLPGETVEGAFRIAEEIRASVLSLRAQQQGRLDVSPTVSVGVAAMTPQAGLAPHDLIRSADLALYEAKHAGRDRSIAAPPILPLRNKWAA
ncbi:diguanylate cyclase [Bradyrhizobium sp. Ash2021]|uniref:sensor domain-containing diguanylate cyclase n=1 Tax=Bradyrhizobium sp. Ash2021 TaxID=2954771 RepID=UPI0028149F2D|nr:diguanylate cyclase [Bradyrhizobium sp. Ash2021]WMT71952.1 diguanylate cyclase [Bradyrhizobium sp. Ash2021]